MKASKKVSTSSISLFKACLFTQPTYNLWLWTGPPKLPMNRQGNWSARIQKKKNNSFYFWARKQAIKNTYAVKPYKWDIKISTD